LQDEAPVVSVGDFNAFEVNDGYVDVLGTVLGRPAPAHAVVLGSPDLVDPDFINAGEGSYSYVFEGNAQSLDHVLISQRAAAQFVELQHARVNADFPEVLRGALTSNGDPRPERLSDHDPAVAYFALTADVTPPAIISVSPSVRVLRPADGTLVPVTLMAEVSDDGAAPVCAITRVFSSEPVTGRGDVTSPDWVVDSPLTLRLRAERRTVGLGRFYVVLVGCTDAAGNQTTSGTWLFVPRF